jgi:hypothetical protein
MVKEHTLLFMKWRRFFTQIDNKATKNGATPAERMTLTEANTCYFRGERAIYTAVPDKTPAGRPRIIPKMKWGTVVKYIISDCPDTHVFWWCHLWVITHHYSELRQMLPGVSLTRRNSAHTSTLLSAQRITLKRSTLVSRTKLTTDITQTCVLHCCCRWNQNQCMQHSNKYNNNKL